MAEKKTQGKQGEQPPKRGGNLPDFDAATKAIAAARAADPALLEGVETFAAYTERIRGIIDTARGADAHAFVTSGSIQDKSPAQIAALERYAELKEAAGFGLLPDETAPLYHGEYREAGYDPEAARQFYSAAIPPALLEVIASGDLQAKTAQAKRKATREKNRADAGK